ncbi:MAG: hypothetical protein KAG61_06095 [Bacteriovoracaceae bacterium]|nr:hypothetical protein [Bacteriovoracaceae bacterium]
MKKLLLLTVLLSFTQAAFSEIDCSEHSVNFITNYLKKRIDEGREIFHRYKPYIDDGKADRLVDKYTVKEAAKKSVTGDLFGMSMWMTKSNIERDDLESTLELLKLNTGDLRDWKKNIEDGIYTAEIMESTCNYIELPRVSTIRSIRHDAEDMLDHILTVKKNYKKTCAENDREVAFINDVEELAEWFKEVNAVLKKNAEDAENLDEDSPYVKLMRM